MRAHSRFGYLKTWRVFRFIVKSGDDLRQEQFAMQMIQVINEIFKADSDTNKIYLRPYEIIATGKGCGVIEYLEDTLSIDYIKRKMVQRGGQGTLLEYFETNFGGRKSKGF